MADIWGERLKREMNLRGAVILSGNTNDIILNSPKNGEYTSIVEYVTSLAVEEKYEQIITWNRAEGGLSKKNGENSPSRLENIDEDNQTGQPYDLGEEGENLFSEEQKVAYDKPADFFPYLRKLFEKKKSGIVAVIDYSDYLFGDGRGLSEEERNNITNLLLAITKNQDYEKNYLDNNGNLIVLITKSTAMLPPSFYVDNPLIATINVPMPGRNEREKFVTSLKSSLKLSPPIDEVMADFIDSLDGFTLKNIAQIIKLSKLYLEENNQEELNFEKLLTLYRYGEKISPWEELSYEKLSGVEEALRKRVKGQDEAVHKVRDVIIRAFTGFSGLQHSAQQKKPKGALFFVGPTGVGKTELAKALAQFVFGDESAYKRFDMSEYAHEQSDQRLVGAPPGYVGYEKGGELTNAVKAKPFCVLLFDEIEKAHGRIMDKFLQILEDGRLTDGKGETVYFSETFIIFTSNIGASDADISEDPEVTRKYFIEEVKKHFIDNLKRPEILNRIGDANIVPFNFIKDDDVLISIAKSKFIAIKKFIKERYKAEVEFPPLDESIKERFKAHLSDKEYNDEDIFFRILAKCVDKANGGRGMLNAMEQKLINPLSDFVFANMKKLVLGGRTIEITIDPSPNEDLSGEIDIFLK